jgi:hypothetical protein
MRDRHRQRGRVAADLQDGRFRVVTDSAIDRLNDVPLSKLANRAGEVVRRLGLSERSARQGGDQTQQEHRQTPHGTHLLVYTPLLSTQPAIQVIISL